MCGITGILNIKHKPVDLSILTQMSDSLYHRGPDDGGYHIDNTIGLAHRRLSIIDLSTGKQPIYNEDKSVVVVFNGEIYNYQELRTELQQAGHHFASSTDTEVIVHAWEMWQESCIERFRGMFAFALWDLRQNLLFLARDRLGIKPLYYSHLEKGAFVFGSELKAIVQHPAFRHKIDPLAVEDYFAYGYIPDPRTIYQNVYKLPPGHFLRISNSLDNIAPVRYWDIQFGNTTPQLSEQTAAVELVERLQDAVRVRLISDVPLGAFLSGGVDSSAVVALMAELQAEPTKTCSIAFDNPAFNEAPYAEEVANRYHTDHLVQHVEHNDFELVDLLTELHDEPFADSSALPTYQLCKLARKRVTVALSGDGGDENFAGYRDHRVHVNKERIRNHLPASLRSILFGGLGRIYPKIDWAPRYLRARTTFETLAMDSASSFARGRMITTSSERNRLFSTSFQSKLQGYDGVEVMRAHAVNAPSEHPLSFAQYLDMKVYLPADILTKVDRASMAHSLEVRVPILDHQFVEWVAALSPNLKYQNGIGKYIFKKAFEPYLSKRILYRRKMGFSIPIAAWLRGPLRKRLQNCILDSRLNDTNIFNQHSLQQFVEEHLNGKRDHSSLLWALIMFESFLRCPTRNT
ncbi:MAG: XrtA/PEP-CTERM system amidotransferase [Pirellulales bacterium]